MDDFLVIVIIGSSGYSNVCFLRVYDRNIYGIRKGKLKMKYDKV